MGQLAVAVAAVLVRSLDQGTCRTRLCHASDMTIEVLQYIVRFITDYIIPGMARPCGVGDEFM